MMFRIVTLSMLMAAVLLGLLGCGGEDGPKAPAVATLRTAYGANGYDAAWVAFQDGSGAWKVLLSKSPGLYTANVTDAGGRFGFVVVSPNAADLPRVTVYQSTLAETATIQHQFTAVTVGVSSLSGTIAGATVGAASVSVHAGLYASPSTSPADPYYLGAMASGVYDLVALRRNLSPGAITGMYVARSLGIGGANTQNIDFGNINFATEPVPYKVFIPAGATGRVDLVTKYRTVAPVSEIGLMSGEPVTYAALPPGFQHTGDLYVASADAEATAGAITTRQSTRRAFHTPAIKTVTLPTLFNSAFIHLVGSRITVGWQPYASAQAYNLRFAPSAGNNWSVWLSSGWLNGNQTYSYTLPTLTAFPTWQSAWDPTGGEQQWNADAYVSNRPLQDVLGAVRGATFADGMQIDIAGSGWRRLE